MAGIDMAALVDALIPGDGDFPSASSVGVHGQLTHRLRELRGPSAYRQLRQVWPDAQTTAASLSQLEQASPELFNQIRMITYLSYYEQPAVIDVIRALGFDYNDAPQPDGYQLEPFDPAVDLPNVKGHFVATSAFANGSGGER